jgi:salicylate hydroxylase
MGHGRHVLTFPVGNPGPDQFLNLVAFVTDSNEAWPSKDARSLTLPATREEAIHDFERGGFGQTDNNQQPNTKHNNQKHTKFPAKSNSGTSLNSRVTDT